MCHNWQFLSVLDWFLCDLLLIYPDILGLETRHLSLPSFPLSPLMWLTLITLWTKPAHSGNWLIAVCVSCPHSQLCVRIPACLLCWLPGLPLTSAYGGLQVQLGSSPHCHHSPQLGSRGGSHLLGPFLSAGSAHTAPRSSPDLGLERNLLFSILSVSQH